MKRGLQLVLGTVLFFFGWVSASPGTELLQLDKYQRMAYRVKPAIVRVLAFVQGTVTYETEEGKKTDKEIFTGGSGSGFIVNPNGFVVTNGHVVETIHRFNTDKDQVVKEILRTFLMKRMQQDNLPLTKKNALQLVEKLKPEVTDLQPGNFVVLSNLKKYRYEIKQYSKAISAAALEKGGEGKDIAVLKIEGKDLPIVRIGDSDKVSLQGLVFAFGYPGAADTPFIDPKSTMAEVTISRGTVSAVKRDFKGMPIIQSDVTISWGNSGGPSLNENGEVIGVNSYVGLTVNPFLGTVEKAAGIGFIVPANSVKEFLNAAGAKEEPGLFNGIYDRALEKIWAGKWFEGKDLLDKALVFLPEQPDLLRLKTEVETAIDRLSWPERQWQKNKIGTLGLSMLLLLLMGAGGYWGVKRFRPQIQQSLQAAEPAENPILSKEQGWGTLTLCVDGQLGEGYPLQKKGLVIGREPGQCDILILDPNVSRVHARVVIENGEVIVLDLESTNGTFVNNSKVEKTKLKPGDVIHLGQKCPVTLVFKQ